MDKFFEASRKVIFWLYFAQLIFAIDGWLHAPRNFLIFIDAKMLSDIQNISDHVHWRGDKLKCCKFN